MITKRKQLSNLETELKGIQLSQQFVTKNPTEWQRLQTIIDCYHGEIKKLKASLTQV